MPTRVLIVEDEPEFLRRFADAVIADPDLHLVAAVASGKAGRALLDAEAVDVLLVDLGLPDMDGTDLIRHAVLRHPGCDCLVVTMFADDAHVMASLEAGATGYLLKDARNERIACAVHEAVSKNTELDVMSWIMRRVPIYRQTCRHANEKPSRVPTICHTKDGRWMMSWGASATDKGKLVPFLDRFDMAADLQAPQTGGERHARNVPGSGASDEATAHAL